MKTLFFLALAASALITNLHVHGVMTQVAPIDRIVGQLLAAVGFLG